MFEGEDYTRDSPTSTTPSVDVMEKFYDEPVDVVGLENSETTRVT